MQTVIEPSSASRVAAARGQGLEAMRYPTQEVPMNTRASLIEKIESLPDERLAEIEDFIDFIRMREEARTLRRAFASASEPAFAKVWDNPQDSIYDAI
jgi:hypothetical protein